MIHSTVHPTAEIAAPKRRAPVEMAMYFDPRLRVVTAKAQMRDAQPIDALDQIFGYYQP